MSFHGVGGNSLVGGPICGHVNLWSLEGGGGGGGGEGKSVGSRHRGTSAEGMRGLARADKYKALHA